MNIQSTNRKQGATGEAIVAMELRSRGVCLVERVHTPWGIQRAKGGRITGAYPLEKVSGDFVGILAGGRFVRCEVKTTDGRLPYSQLEPHQHSALLQHHELGGLSLVGWVHDGIVSIMQYPVMGWVAGKSIRKEDVIEWALDD